ADAHPGLSASAFASIANGTAGAGCWGNPTVRSWLTKWTLAISTSILFRASFVRHSPLDFPVHLLRLITKPSLPTRTKCRSLCPPCIRYVLSSKRKNRTSGDVEGLGRCADARHDRREATVVGQGGRHHRLPENWG